MKKQRLLKIVQSVLSAESGRSMVEMLGVLAIIGVLSIGAVAGYKFALNKFRANEIINELNARALSVSAQMLSATTPYESDEVIEDGFGNTLAVGYSAESAVSSQNPDYFEITINGIPSEVCTQILRDYENPIMIFVNEVRYNNDTSLCTTESGTVDMGFIYRRDLGERETCSERGYFGEEDFMCHCAGNTYIDPNNPNECLCPAGHVWSAKENTCVESICEEGEFESLSDGCVPCSSPSTYYIPDDERQQKLCQACQNSSGNQIREVIKNNTNSTYSCVNTQQNNCKSKESFRQLNGTCLPCDTQKGYSIGSDEISEKLCTDCGRQIVRGYFNSHYCVLPTMCNKGTEYIFDNAQYSGYLECTSCDTMSAETRFFLQPYGTLAQEYCNACQSGGEQNRKYVNAASYPTCVKIKCDSGEFFGADGKCHLCTDPTKREVNPNSGCTDTACGRQEIVADNGKTYCQPMCQTADGSHVEINGNCYSCDGTTDFNATKAQCDLCTNPPRLWVGNYGTETTGGTCMEKCDMKVHTIGYTGNNYSCYACGGYHEGYTPGGGYTDVSKDYCEACGNYVVTPDDGNKPYCVKSTSCQQGSEFRRLLSTNYKFCMSCDLTDAVKIGDTQGHRDMCLKCTSTKRFWAGEYCYRCDTAEAPDVDPFNEAEINSCTSCTQREVKEDKCVLKQ